ncbi:MAG: hypothetical protein LBF80_01750 [Spirochaetaceae bacterium]|nr:hypothetical protein [Spirochaetaceae bacterium]
MVYKNAKEIRELCTKAIGGAMDLKDKDMEAAEVVKESAEDLLAEADVNPAIGKELLHLEGVKSVTVNPRTGSILILYYHGRITESRLGAALQNSRPKKGKPGECQTGRAVGGSSSLAWSYIDYQLSRLFLPPLLKPLFTLLGAVPFF